MNAFGSVNETRSVPSIWFTVTATGPGGCGGVTTLILVESISFSDLARVAPKYTDNPLNGDEQTMQTRTA